MRITFEIRGSIAGFPEPLLEQALTTAWATVAANVVPGRRPVLSMSGTWDAARREEETLRASGWTIESRRRRHFGFLTIESGLTQGVVTCGELEPGVSALRGAFALDDPPQRLCLKVHVHDEEVAVEYDKTHGVVSVGGSPSVSTAMGAALRAAAAREGGSVAMVRTD